MIALTGGDIVLPDRIISSGAIVLDGGRVASVEHAADACPAGAERLDVSDCYVVPGFVEVSHVGPSSVPPQFVPDTIDDGLPQVRLQRADPTGLEVVDSFERLQQRVLDKVLGVRQVARPSRQSSFRPTLEGDEVPGQQPIERLQIALSDSFQQVNRCFGLGRAGRDTVLRSRRATWLVHDVSGEPGQILTAPVELVRYRLSSTRADFELVRD